MDAAEHIRRLVDAAPPLTEAQLAELRAIFGATSASLANLPAAPASGHKHRLPVSYGYSAGTAERPPMVRCGICKQEFPIDREWIARYFEAQRHRVWFDPERWQRLTPEEVAPILDRLDREEAALLEVTPE